MFLGLFRSATIAAKRARSTALTSTTTCLRIPRTRPHGEPGESRFGFLRQIYQPRQSTPMQLGPSRPPLMAALPQQEVQKLLACSAQCKYRVAPGAHQIAHRLVPGIRNSHRCQLARSMQPRETGCIPPIGLHSVIRFASGSAMALPPRIGVRATTRDAGYHSRTRLVARTEA
jgi:hypothetical protein